MTKYTVKLTAEQTKDVAEIIAHLYIAGWGEAHSDAQGNVAWKEEYRQKAREMALDLKEYGITLPYPWLYETPWDGNLS